MRSRLFLAVGLAISAHAEVNVEYGSGGGRPLLLDYARPQQTTTNPAPAILFIHGGGWRTGDKAHPPTRQLNQHGYFTASVNYRLGVPFPAAVEDVKCAVRWLRANANKLGVDPNRIGVWGALAGGHLAEFLVTTVDNPRYEGVGGWSNTSSRVATVVSFFGPSDFNTDNSRFQNGLGLITSFMGGTLTEKPDVYREASPLTHVTKTTAPMLLVHGDSDSVVPLDQSLRMAEALKKAGVEHRLIVVTNGIHGVFINQALPISPSVAKIQQAVVDWFDQHLRSVP